MTANNGTKQTAGEKELGELHVIVARVLAAQVGQEVPEYDDDGQETGMVFVSTPALLTVAIRFLKDNDITCEAGESEGASELRDALAKRKKRSSTLAKITPLHPDEEAALGG